MAHFQRVTGLDPPERRAKEPLSSTETPKKVEDKTQKAKNVEGKKG